MLTGYISKSTHPNGTGLGSGAVQVDFYLKQPTSKHNLMIEVTNFDFSTAFDYNLFYVPDWQAVYDISDIVSVSSTIVIFRCSYNHLRSAWVYKGLPSVTGWIYRSSTHPHLEQVDPTWQHNNTPQTSYQIMDLPEYTGTWSYILQVVNSDTDSTTAGGATSLYAVTPVMMRLLINTMFNSSLYGGLSEDVKTFFNPFQYIINCFMVPFPATFLSDSALKPLKFGWWNPNALQSVTCNGRPIDIYGKRLEFNFTMSVNNNFTDRDSDWSQYTLYVPGFDIIEIDPQLAGTDIYVTIDLDFLTTSAYMQLHAISYTGPILASARGQMGIPVQLTQLMADVSSLKSNRYQSDRNTIAGVTGAVGGVAQAAGAAYNGDVTGAIAGLSHGINSAAGAYYNNRILDMQYRKLRQSPSLSLAGTAGDRYSIFKNIQIIVSSKKYQNIYKPAGIGSVCNRNMVLSTQAGFTQLGQVLTGFRPSGFSENDIAALNNILTGGFYIE